MNYYCLLSRGRQGAAQTAANCVSVWPAICSRASRSPLSLLGHHSTSSGSGGKTVLFAKQDLSDGSNSRQLKAKLFLAGG